MKNKRLRRPLALLLCIVMLLGIMPTISAAETEPVNKIYDSLQNGDFETDIANLWFPLNSASADKFGWEKTQVKDGSGAIRVVSGRDVTVGNYGAQSHLFKVDAGKTYTVSCDFKSTHNVATATIAIFYYNANNVRVESPDTTWSAMPTNSQSWTDVSFDSTAPAGAVTARIILTGNHANGPTEYFDNLSVESSVNKIYDSLQNPGFELTDASGKLTHWYAFDVESHSRSNEHVTEGSYSMKIEDNGLYVAGARSNRVQVTPGKRYRASIDCYAATEGTQAQLYLQFFNAAGAATTTIGYGSGDGIEDTVVVEAVAPDDAVYAAIMPLSHSSQEGVFYFDNATFGLVPPPTYSDTLLNPSVEIADDSNPQMAEGYSLFGSTTYKMATRTNEKASHGEWSMKMTDASNNTNVGFTTPAFKVEPGVTYRATGDFYMEGGYIQFAMLFFDADGNRISYASVDIGGKDKWRTGTVDGDAPTGAVFARLQISQSVDNVGIAYADNFTVEPYENLTEWTILDTGHPRLYFSANEVNAIKARANDATVNPFGYSNKETFDAILAKADDYLTETEFSISYYNGYIVTYPSPVVTQPDNPNPPPGYTAAGYPYWTMLSYEIEDRLSYLSLAYLVTGEQKYFDKAVDHMEAMMGWNVWHDPYTAISDGTTASLDTSHITMGMSLAYDLLYNDLTEDFREQVRTAIQSKGLAPLYIVAANKGDNNIAAIRAAALGIGACAIADPTDAELSEQVGAYLSRANDFYAWYLDARMETGMQEGYQYTSYALENLITAMDIVGRVTGETGLLDNEYFNEVFVDWVVHFMAPGSGALPAISDSNSAAYFFNTMSILNKSKQDGNAGYYLSAARPNAESLLQKFLYTSESPVINDPYKTLKLVYSTSYLGFSALRTGWEEDDMLLTLLANDADIYHNHYDQNSFMLATNSTWIATDAGYGDFVKGTPANEWTFQYGHSTLLVDDQTQSIKGGGSTEKILGNTLYGHVVGSAADAYGEDILEKFDRHALMVNHANGAYYVIYDDIASAGNHTYGWNLNTEGWNTLLVDGNPVSLGSTASGNSLTVEKSTASMFVDFIGNDPLSISGRMYRDSKGPYITAYSPATDDYQYMAVISTAAGTNGIPASSLMNTVKTNNNQETKIVSVNGVECIFFRGAAVDDWFSLDFEVKKAGVFNMSIELPRSPVYGNYQMYIDDVPYGEVYVGYGELALMNHPLGEVSLAEGKHTLKLKLVGKEDASGNYLISVGNIKFGDESDAPTNPITVLETYDTVDYLGSKLDNSAGVEDLILFRRSSNPKNVTVEDLTTDASQVSLLGIEDGSITEGFAAVGVTSLVYNGTTWFTSESPVNVFLDLRDGYARYTIDSAVSQSVTINVDVNGKKQTVSISEGTNEINGGKFEISVTGVTLDAESAEINVDETVTLIATVIPTDASDASISWSSSNPEIATVNNGMVTGIAKGTATITVTTADGGYSDTCEVTINDPASEVEALIDAIGRVTIGSKQTIQAARDAYDDLTPEQQAKVDNYDVLLAAEAEYRRQMLALGTAISGGATSEPVVVFPFTDVPETAWYHDEVKKAWESDLIDGVTATEYKPNETLTVAQAIKLAAALHQMHFDGEVTLKNGAHNWYDSYVDYAVANRIIEAKYDSYTLAQMNAPVSREEFVHIFFGAMPASRYAACNAVADNAIPDVKMGDAFADEIYTFYRAGILTGSDLQGTFYPDSSIKRSEVAAILIRMFDTNARQAVTLG